MSLSLSNANLTPIGDRVLVKLASAEEEKVGGIYIPDSAKEKPQTAEVVALGTGKKDGEAIDFQVKVGDQVLISKYGGTEIKIDGELFNLLREDDILGIIG
ncbi:MAG: co-chaperone GroES [Opitutales bacterium]|nr:co-chaperone GroES [Opitutales bacterium]